ncbi:MAG: UDP-N-acetylmuramate--L-alanine ligase, partial [Actinomycetota bacterium]|nr:UDP-N-acetylmuramate--L-alanine ligase [Actinomycetota bacterium]
LLLSREMAVTGSDLKESAALVQLRALGAAVRVGHDAESIGDADVVVMSTAIPATNVEVEEARRRGIPVLARAQLLAALMREGRGVAVAGTHGKTTTTSMLAAILEGSGLDPTYVIGGDLNESGSNARSGSGDVFLAEADESDGSFLLLRPDIAVVTNVEDDHLDFYRGIPEIEAAFVTFCSGAGFVVACADDAGARRVGEATGGEVVWYGEADGSDVLVDHVRVDRDGGRCRLRMAETGRAVNTEVEISLPVPGKQYLLNAAAAVAVAVRLGVSKEDAATALRGFAGVRRRWELRGSARGASFVDDYAHHPTEIAATLAAARAEDGGRVVVVFQPHRFSRTQSLWRGLGESLVAADVVVVTDVYGAGEQAIPGVSGKLVVDSLAEAAPGKRAVYLPRRPDVAPFLAREVRDGDLVLTLGAGDITMVGDEVLALIGDRG